MRTLESSLGNEYLNGSVFPILPPLSHMPRQLSIDESSGSFPPVPPKNDSQAELSAFSRIQLGSNRSSTSSPISMSNFRQSGAGLPVSVNAKKRQTVIGVMSSPGRQFKVLADFFLLAGGLEAAVIWSALTIASEPILIVRCTAGTMKLSFCSRLRKTRYGTLPH